MTVTNDGQNFLVAWSDQRSVVSEFYEARVSPAGVLLDPYSIRSSRVSTLADTFALAGGGGQQFMMWQDEAAQQIAATRGSIGPTGQVPTPFDILPPMVVGFGGTAASWDGTAFNVALPRSNPAEVVLFRVFPDGGSSSPSAILAPQPAPQFVTGVASSGGIAGVSRVTLSGGAYVHDVTLVDPASGAALSTVNLGTGGRDQRIAADARGFVVAYSDLSSSPHVHLRRVLTDGGMPDDGGSDVTADGGYELLYSVDVLANGNTAVALTAPIQGSVGVKEVAEDGGAFTTVFDVLSTDAGAYAQYPSMSCLGANCLLAWYSTNAISLTGAIYTQGGTLQAPFPLQKISRSQWSPKAAFAGGRYLVVWVESDPQSSEFYGRLIDETGDPLSAPLLLFSSRAISPPLHGSFDLVSLGGRFLVLYAGGTPSVLQGRFVELDGGVGAPFDLMQGSVSGPGDIVAASTGELALAVWSTFASTGGFHISAARIAADGTVLDFDGLPVATSPNASPLMAVSPGANGFQLVWLTYVFYGNPTTLYTASVFPDGGGVNETTTALLTMPGSQSQPSPALGFDGAHHYATWVDGADGTGHPTIRLLQFDEDGGVAVDGGETLSAAGANGTPGEISCGPSDCTVLYSELFGGSYELRGTVFSSDGGRRSFGRSLVTQSDDEVLPSSAAGDAGWLLTWARYQAAPYGSLRVMSRVIDGPGLGVDAGSDAGSTDGGTDAGELDAGGTDAGEQDAGESIPPVRLQLRVGCGCDSAGSVSLFAFAVVASLVFGRRRRAP
ncbi:MAG: hypothetical protein ACJ790_07490 [Myxococcaceae bacterium]